MAFIDLLKSIWVQNISDFVPNPRDNFSFIHIPFHIDELLGLFSR